MMEKNNTSWEKDETVWVREIQKENYISAIGTVSFRTIASAYVDMKNVKIIRLVAKSGTVKRTSKKNEEDLIKEFGVKGIKGKVSDFIINYKLNKDADLNVTNPFDSVALSNIIKEMEKRFPNFYNKTTRQSNPSDLPISLLEIEVTDPKFMDIAKLENPKIDIQLITQKAENDDLKKDIYKYHRDHKLEYLFEHGFKKYTLNCCMVIETLKRFSKEKDIDNALIYWGGIDDLFPRSNYNLWLYIHSHYILPIDFRIKKKIIIYPDDKAALDGYTWG